jgi:hypothetical protein
MKRKRLTEEQVIPVLREHDTGASPASEARSAFPFCHDEPPAYGIAHGMAAGGAHPEPDFALMGQLRAPSLRIRTGLRENATGLWTRRLNISDIEKSSSRDSPPETLAFGAGCPIFVDRGGLLDGGCRLRGEIFGPAVGKAVRRTARVADVDRPFAMMILLWVEKPEEEDVDNDRTSKQRLQDRLSRYR